MHNSLYDEPTRLLFTGIRNWRICRCYSVPQWIPCPPGRPHGCLISTFPAHTGYAPVISGLHCQDRDPHPTSPPGATSSLSIERPRTRQQRHDRILSKRDPLNEKHQLHMACTIPSARAIRTLGMFWENSRQMYKGQWLGILLIH